jgi:hypothetical protein
MNFYKKKKISDHGTFVLNLKSISEFSSLKSLLLNIFSNGNQTNNANEVKKYSVNHCDLRGHVATIYGII